MMTELKTVRPSPIAGTWYSANPDRLRKTIDSYIEKAALPNLPGEVVALVAPHAGYQYSGSVAGHAYKAIAGKSFDTVAVISPMHQYHPRPLLTSAHRAYGTPLGEIPLAAEKVAEINTALQERAGVSLTPINNDREHSLEIELPFLQRAIKGEFNLIPIMLRDQSRAIAQTLGEILAEELQGESCLLVASSDLSHFYPETVANQLDNRVLSALNDFSPDGLFDLKDQGKGHACGLAAIAAVLWSARKLGAKDVTLLCYDTSASTTGDKSSVVGYGAAAITRPV
ncbi:MAG: AmmeMemoRadiSam system protein B [Chloroflexota bacterium]|nr:AmmeMemoRadiSam system protein B [Chloroflexota bacterium]